MDFLGLRNLTVLDDAAKLVQRREPGFDPKAIPEDDAETFKMLSEGRTSGVFQMESAGMTGVCVGLKPQSIEDHHRYHCSVPSGPHGIHPPVHFLEK